MNTTHRQGNTGILVGIGALAVLVIAALLIQKIIVSPILERERAALSKSLHIQQMLVVLGAQDEKTRNELALHLSVLRDGGEFIALNGNNYTIPASDSNGLIAAANSIEEVVSQGGHSTLPVLVGGMLEAQQQAWSQLAKKVTWYRWVVGVNACLLLAFIFQQFYRRLRRTKLLWGATLRENKTILEATKDGLFLIKPSLLVGSVQSGAVKTIFGIDMPISGNFFDFLKRIVNAADLADAKEYISKMLEGRAGQLQSGVSNPLKEVEIMVEDTSGLVVTKYINFDFTRNELNPGAGLLVAVSDITKEVKLKQQLLEANRENDERFSMLMGSIAEDSSELSAFYKTAHEGLYEINGLLRDDEHEHESNVQKLEDIARTVQRLKEEAGSVGIPLIETSALKFERKIHQLLDLPQVNGKQILELTVNIRQMISELNFLEQLNSKLRAKQVRNSPKLASVNDASTSVSSLASVGSKNASVDTSALSAANAAVNDLDILAMQAAKRQGKAVRIECSGFENFTISRAVKAEIDELCAQLTLNSVIHGIELPDVRQKLGKPAEGLITVDMKMRDDERVVIQVADDGRGFDFSAIRERAVEQGLVAADVVKAMRKPELVKFIFVSGFSTIVSSESDDGEGFGLDLVKKSVVRLDGKISVKSTRGVSSQVTILLPITALELAPHEFSDTVYSDAANAV